MRQQKEFGSTFDKTERTLVNEINEECRRTSEVLGLSPRKVNLTRFVAKYLCEFANDTCIAKLL